MSQNISSQTTEHIPAEMFTFVQEDEKLRDRELQTKARSFFADAMLRFSKNKSSVVAAWILLFLVLFSLLAPAFSPYSIKDTDKLYINYPPFVRVIAEMNLGILDGAKTFDSQNDVSMTFWRGIAEETGMDPVLRTIGQHETEVKYRGKMVTRYTYDIEVNAYYAMGVVYRVFSYDEYKRIQEWQNETGIQVIYPYVRSEDISGITDNANLWYQVDANGAAVLDKDDNFVPESRCTSPFSCAASWSPP